MKLSDKERADLRAAVKTILSRAKNYKIKIPKCGICMNLSQELMDRGYYKTSLVCDYACYDELFKGWDKHSGCACWPIIGFDSKKWKGNSRLLRISLLEHMLRKLDGDVCT